MLQGSEQVTKTAHCYLYRPFDGKLLCACPWPTQPTSTAGGSLRLNRYLVCQAARRSSRQLIHRLQPLLLARRVLSSLSSVRRLHCSSLSTPSPTGENICYGWLSTRSQLCSFPRAGPDLPLGCSLGPPIFRGPPKGLIQRATCHVVHCDSPGISAIWSTTPYTIPEKVYKTHNNVS